MSWANNTVDNMTRKTYLSQRIVDLEQLGEPGDKRGYALATYLYLEEVGGSVNGWLALLGDSSAAEHLGQDVMEKAYRFYREHSLSYLRNDRKILPQLFPNEKNIGMIARHIDTLVADVEKQEPADVQDYEKGAYTCIRHMLGGLNGWYNMLGNEKVVDAGPLEAYKELYEFVKPFALGLMKFELEQVEQCFSAQTKL